MPNPPVRPYLPTSSTQYAFSDIIDTNDGYVDADTGLIYPPHRLSDYYGAEDWENWEDPDKPVPESEVEFVSGNYYWFEDSSFSRVNSGTYDDSYTGTYNLGFTFRFGNVNYTNYYVSSNGYITFGSGSSLYYGYPLTSFNHSNGVWGYPYDMYQGYSQGYGSYGAWSAHGSSTGQAHGVWHKSGYTVPGGATSKAHAMSWMGTTYTSSYRGRKFGYTFVFVTDDDKTWIQITHYDGISSMGTSAGVKAGGVVTVSLSPYSLSNKTHVFEGDVNGQNCVYKGFGRLRVKNTSNWVY